MSATSEVAGAGKPPRSTVDLHQVLRRKSAEVRKRLIIRCCIVGTLGVSQVVLAKLDIPNDVWTVLPGTVGVMIFVWSSSIFGPTLLRLSQAKRIVKHYPLRFRAFARHKDSEHSKHGRIFTFVVAEEDRDRKSRRMRGVELWGRHGWPETAQHGVWVAGDLAFGGLALVPDSGTLLVMKPAVWKELAQEREQAGADRIAKAKQAGIKEWELKGVGVL